MKTIIKINLIVVLSFLMLGITASAQNTAKSAEIKIKASVMCGMCKARVEKNMAYEKGVKAVTVDLATKEVIITYNPQKTTPALLKTAISKIGYDADEVPADSVAYEKLPPCCKKEAVPHE
jgi:periplasmic mercuric ion binding protein